MSPALVSNFLSAIPMPLIVINSGERIVAANERATTIFGAGLDGRHYVTMLRTPLLLDCIETALRLSEPSQTQITLRKDAGRESVFDVRAVPVDGMVVVSFEDQSQLQDAVQMRRDFVANVSHELRTPLTAMSGFIETLRGPAKDDAAARERFLEIMDREAGRMNRLVSDLLSLSRVESQERLRPTSQVDVTGLIGSAVSALRPLAKSNGVEVVIEAPGAPVHTLGDTDQLQQVFVNLIENGIKYGGAGGIVTVCVTEHDHDPSLRIPAIRIDVADQGEGIDTHHIPRLTERFYRVDGHRSREMGGTGLGLAIVKHIVNRHRGRLRIESHPGKGTCMTVLLPHDM